MGVNASFFCAQRPCAGRRNLPFDQAALIVYAVQYELDTKPPSWLIVWLDGDGNSLHPWVRPGEDGRRIVATRCGDVIVHRGEPKMVAGVAVYRALGVKPGREVVG